MPPSKKWNATSNGLLSRGLILEGALSAVPQTMELTQAAAIVTRRNYSLVLPLDE